MFTYYLTVYAKVHKLHTHTHTHTHTQTHINFGSVVYCLVGALEQYCNWEHILRQRLESISER